MTLFRPLLPVLSGVLGSVLGCVLGLMVPGAASAGAAATPNAPPTRLNGVIYARPEGIPLRLDGVIPPHHEPIGVALLVHGGSWAYGSRSTFMAPLERLLERDGIAWISIDYRLAPKHPFPAPLQDVKAALAWLRAHLHTLNLDPDQMFLIGESAGGELAALAATQDTGSPTLTGVVDFYGPNDLTLIPGTLTEPPEAIRAFLDITTWDATARRRLRAASPSTFVREGLPPFLLIHGTADHIVPSIFSEVFCKDLKAAKDACKLVLVPNVGHGMEAWERTLDDHPENARWKPILSDWLASH